MQQTLDFVASHKNEDIHKLALQASRYPQVDMSWAIDQIAGYQIARQKLPSYAVIDGILYPHHLSMEQCSSEITARYKAKVIQDTQTSTQTLVDLTAGFGVDFSFIAPLFEKATAIEQQAYLCDILRKNHLTLGLIQATVENTDSIEYLHTMKSVDWLFLDPARRDSHGGKMVAIEDCQPDVSALEEELLQHAHYVMVKLSPMLDISLALHSLHHVCAIHVVAVEGECKELLFILGPDTPEIHQIPITAVSLGRQESTFTFTIEEEIEAKVSYASQPLKYLYEPHAALIKSGAYKSLAARLGLNKLHPNSHLYTSEELLEDFPGRVFYIDGFSNFGKKELKQLLQNETQANLTVRNFPESVATLRKRLKLKEGGSCYLFASTLNDGSKVLIKCSKS